MKAGLIGTGNISGIYLDNSGKFGELEIVACADLDVERAKAKGAEYGIRGLSVEALLCDPEIEMVINLTVPQAHAEVSRRALEAGKHVYSEKPIAVTREEAAQLLELAKEQGLLIGSAPDTFLGAGIQTCIHLIDQGAIGTPVGATAFMLSGGVETWHPNPEFFYKRGGGPMFDMGPYYLTAMVAMLGPIRRVTGSARISFRERYVTSEPMRGQRIEVEVPTHIAGVIEFEAGPIGTLVTSFDVKGGSQLPRIEIYGSEGTISVPDPNTFGGPVRICRIGEQWEDVPLTLGNAFNSRGIGAADMASALRAKRPHRASGKLAYHVLEAMHGFHDAASSGRHYVMQSQCTRPVPLPAGMKDYELD